MTQVCAPHKLDRAPAAAPSLPAGASAAAWRREAAPDLKLARCRVCLGVLAASVRTAHTATFLSVVGFLWASEGTLSLGSKWCTYCLLFSATYAAEPCCAVAAKSPRAGTLDSTHRKT